MNIISTIKNFFASIAGTPVTQTRLTFTEFKPVSSTSMFSATVQPKPSAKLSGIKKIFSNIDVSKVHFWANRRLLILKILFRRILMLSRFFRRTLCSVIVLVALAHFVPELREQLPSLYKIVDLLIVCFEKLFSAGLNFIEISV